MSSENPKQALLLQFAMVAKAIGHPFRLELLEFLAQGERSVESLAQRADLTIGNASQHLQQLRRAGLVTSRRDGKYIYYRLADVAVVALLADLRSIARRNIAEVERVVDSYFHRLDELEPVSREQLTALLRDGLVTLLDVRPGDEFAAGHLPGALNIPLKELETRLAELDSGREVIAYCRGPYCVLSFEAVALLRSRGYNVRRLEDGFPDWAAAGLPVESYAGIK